MINEKAQEHMICEGEKQMDKPILDVCCGPKMFWFDKNNPYVVFCDKRTLEKQEYSADSGSPGHFFLLAGKKPGAGTGVGHGGGNRTGAGHRTGKLRACKKGNGKLGRTSGGGCGRAEYPVSSPGVYEGEPRQTDPYPPSGGDGPPERPAGGRDP